MRALHLGLFELRSYLRDRADLAFSLLLPIVLLAVMLGAFGQETKFSGTAYVVDQDRGMHAQNIISRLRETEGLTVKVISDAEAGTKLDRSVILLATYIPEGFSRRLEQGEQASVTFRQRGNGGQEGQIVASIVRGAVLEIAGEAQVQRQVQAALYGSGIPDADISATVEKFLGRERKAPTLDVVQQDLGKKPNPLYLFFPGVITMFALFAVSLRAQALLDERQNGTLERLLVTRLGPGQLFLGKFAGGFGRGLTQMVVLLVLGAIVFGIFTPVSFVSTLAVAAVFVATVSAAGLVIASISRSRDQATWIAVIFTLVMSMLGGTFFEVGSSGVLHTLSRGTINYYANSALRTLMTGDGTLADVSFQVAVIGAVGLAALLAARALFRVVPGGK